MGFSKQEYLERVAISFSRGSSRPRNWIYSKGSDISVRTLKQESDDLDLPSYEDPVCCSEYGSKNESVEIGGYGSSLDKKWQQVRMESVCL